MDIEIEKAATRYCIVWALASAGVLVGVCLFNAVVDPFGMYRMIDIAGFNAHKPAIYNRVRLLKAFEVRRIKPEAIVLGTSRSHIALRSSHSGWNPSATPRYNLAFDSATSKEMYHYLRHAYLVHPLTQVVLGLDTSHITSELHGARPDFDPQLLYGNASDFLPPYLFRADLKILVNLDSLKASIETLRAQKDHLPEWFSADGQRQGEAFFRNYAESFIKQGQRAYFDEIEKKEVGFQFRELPDRAIHNADLKDESENRREESNISYVQHIVEFCRLKHIDLRIFITPSHAHYLESLVATGRWTDMEDGKRQLVRILSEDSAQHPGEALFPLWDFSGYSSITTEPIPVQGTHEEMKFYWDLSHFKENVGDFVLDRLFETSKPINPIPNDFGVLLNTQNVEAILAKTRADHNVYRKEHSNEIATIHSYVDSIKSKRAKNTHVTIASNLN